MMELDFSIVDQIENHEQHLHFLQEACKTNNYQLAKELLYCPIKQDLHTLEMIMTIMIEFNFPEMVNLFVDYGCNIKGCVNLNAYINTVNMLDFLIKNYFDINETGYMASRFISAEKYDMIEYLLNAGLDPNCDNGSLLITSCRNSKGNIFRLLMQRGGNIESCWPKCMFTCVRNTIGFGM
jgi:hypothetical protein